MPSYFHSVTGVAGMPRAVSKSEMAGMKEVRVQFIVGEKDSYWRTGSERWHKDFVEAGVHTTIEIVPNGGHVMPEIANGPFFERLAKIVAQMDAVER